MTIKLSTGSIEFLKWLALPLMFGDHINLALFDRQLPALSEMSRIVFPIYAFLLAYNLARPGVDLPRVIARLMLMATIAQPFHVLAFPYGVLPLNVLYTFAAAAGIMHLIEKRQAAAAIVVWLVAGVLVDYAFIGVGLTLACWFYFRQPRLARVGAALVFLSALCLLNGNPWALAAIPVIALAAAGQWRLERSPWTFYAAYPAHLCMLAIAAHQA
jgi:hypothetical protein